MLISKYGIMIKKKLQEKYPEKYDELKEKGVLLAIIKDKQFEVEYHKRELLEQNKSLLTKSKMTEILDLINNSIDVIVEEIGSDKF